MEENRPIVNEYYGFVNDCDFFFCEEEMILHKYNNKFLVLIRD